MRKTYMRVSIGTLVENARALRARIPENVKMLCVVKADAYGHGAAKLAPALSGVVDAFAVAIVEEARELRQTGVKNTIVILGGACEESVREAVRCGASQAVYEPEMLFELEDEAKKLGTTAKAHLKVDTGMTRIGVRGDGALNALLDAWKKCPHVEMEGIFTHFCVAENDPEFTRLQNERFERAIRIVRAAGYRPIAHAAASSAMLNPEYQHDMVRAGIALYGGGMPEVPELKFAQTLISMPIRMETIEPGDTVGYGRTFTASRKTRVMTIPIGYGDGYPRLLGNRAEVLIRGKRVPVIGNVCMDMLMADVTDIPEAQMGDSVVLMGAQGDDRITPDELAEKAETIGYEIMLGFSARVPRVYADEREER